MRRKKQIKVALFCALLLTGVAFALRKARKPRTSEAPYISTDEDGKQIERQIRRQQEHDGDLLDQFRKAMKTHPAPARTGDE